MGVLFKQYLSGDKIYACSGCRTHAADHQELVSKAFQGRHGRAYLFSNVVNVSLGPREDRILITGLHTVCDIHCVQCGAVLGWKYEVAFEESQKYKEGKYIIEKAKVFKRLAGNYITQEVDSMGFPSRVVEFCPWTHSPFTHMLPPEVLHIIDATQLTFCSVD